MQKTYVSALGTKYADFGFSKEVFDRVALQRLKTIEKEEEIESDIASPDVLLLLMKEMQGSNDVLRTKVTQTQKELADLKNNSKTPLTEEPNPYADTLAEMKAFMQSMKNEFAESKKKAHTDAVLAKAHEKMKASGCTNDFIRNITLKGIEVGESDTADSIAEKYKSVYDQNCKDAFGDGYVPPKSNANGGGETDQAAITKILQERGLLPKSEN